MPVIQERYTAEVAKKRAAGNDHRHGETARRGVKSVLKRVEEKRGRLKMLIVPERPTKTVRLLLPTVREKDVTVVQVEGWRLGICGVFEEGEGGGGGKGGGFVEWLEAEVGKGGWRVLVEG